jgi:hypothetical protein
VCLICLPCIVRHCCVLAMDASKRDFLKMQVDDPHSNRRALALHAGTAAKA